MISTMGGGQFGDFKKQQDYTYTSPGSGIGMGPRSNPN